MSTTCIALPTLFYQDFDHLTPIENRITYEETTDESPELYKDKRQIGRFDPLFYVAANNRAPAPIPTSSRGSNSHSGSLIFNVTPELYNLVEKRQINGRFSSPFFGAANINRAPAPIPTSNRGSSGSANRAIALANQLAGATRQPVSWSHGYGR